MSARAVTCALKLAAPQTSRGPCGRRVVDQRPVKGKDHSTPRTVVAGGHGKVTLLLALILVAHGGDAVALICDPVQLVDVAAVGVIPRVFSVEDALVEDLAGIFVGVDAIVRTVGTGGKGDPGRTDTIGWVVAIRSMDTTSQAGTRRYVMVSWVGPHGDDPPPTNYPLRNYMFAELAADWHLVKIDLEWTIVDPRALTLEEPSSKIDVRYRNGQGDSLYTSRGNVVVVTAAVLAEFASVGKIISFGDGLTLIAQAVESMSAEFSNPS